MLCKFCKSYNILEICYLLIVRNIIFNIICEE